MKLIKEFLVGIKSYFHVISFIKQHRLWAVAIFPFVFNLVLSVAMLWVVYATSSELKNYFIKWLGLSQEETKKILSLVIQFILNLSLIIVYAKIYRYAMLILISPFLSYISEKVQYILTGNKKPLTIKVFFNDIIRSIRMVLRNLFFELLLSAIVIFVAFHLPLLVILVPILLFIIESYFYGFSILDYRNEALNLNYSKSKYYINAHKGLALGNGTAFNLMLLIPVIGILFAPIVSLIAGALAIQEIEQKNEALNVEKQ